MLRMPSEERLNNFPSEKMTLDVNTAKWPTAKQYTASMIASFGCVCAGTVLAWTSSVLPAITRVTNTTSTQLGDDFLVSDSEAGLIGSMVALGAIVGALPAGYVARRIGITRAFLVVAVLFAIGWAGTMRHTLATMLAARFVGGIATGAVCVCVPLYVSEIASVSIRGVLGSFFQVAFCTGILLVNLVGGWVHWSALAFYMLILPVVHFFAVLCFLPRVDLVAEELTATQPSLRARNHRRALLAGLGLVTCQQLSGVNAVIFYTGGIFAAAGSALTPSVCAVIVTGAQLVIAVVAAALVESCRRRVLLLGSALAMAASLLLLAAYFLAPRTSLPALLPLASLVLFFVAYCAGYGPLPWLMLAEIFAPEFKSVGCSIATTFNWLLVFAVTSLFPVLCAAFGEGYTFALFGAFNIAAVVFTYFCVPETRGKTSAEIQNGFLL